jgi:hypothetical protein
VISSSKPIREGACKRKRRRGHPFATEGVKGLGPYKRATCRSGATLKELRDAYLAAVAHPEDFERFFN